MALYAIGDLHLSFGSDKPMDVFGSGWENHPQKLREAFQILRAEDVCVICGDLSWAMSLEEAEEDFRFLDGLPGTKILIKGNHDYWWGTAASMNAFFERKGFTTLRILHNGSIPYGEDMALCGTRGWFCEEETGSPHDRKVMNREILRLETSLKAAGDRTKLCFLHYPPRFGSYVCREITELLKSYRVGLCCYGHLHGPSHRAAVQGTVEGVRYRLVSADYVGFRPQKLLD